MRLKKYLEVVTAIKSIAEIVLKVVENERF